ncbi:MAG: hypothetical protein NTY81_03735 [Candidatus Staskawiczbacteria bacterium]|nr:hypothetical protein [Candidatus Staskawiczbacteria bacterium]
MGEQPREPQESQESQEEIRSVEELTKESNDLKQEYIKARSPDDFSRIESEIDRINNELVTARKREVIERQTATNQRLSGLRSEREKAAQESAEAERKVDESLRVFGLHRKK